MSLSVTSQETSEDVMNVMINYINFIELILRIFIKMIRHYHFVNDLVFYVKALNLHNLIFYITTYLYCKYTTYLVKMICLTSATIPHKAPYKLPHTLDMKLMSLCDGIMLSFGYLMILYLDFVILRYHYAISVDDYVICLFLIANY